MCWDTHIRFQHRMLPLVEMYIYIYNMCVLKLIVHCGGLALFSPREDVSIFDSYYEDASEDFPTNPCDSDLIITWHSTPSHQRKAKAKAETPKDENDAAAAEPWFCVECEQDVF